MIETFNISHIISNIKSPEVDERGCIVCRIIWVFGLDKELVVYYVGKWSSVVTVMAFWLL